MRFLFIIMVVLLTGCQQYDYEAKVHSEIRHYHPIDMREFVVTMPDKNSYRIYIVRGSHASTGIQAYKIEPQDAQNHVFNSSGGVLPTTSPFGSSKAVKIGTEVFQYREMTSKGKDYYVFSLGTKVALVEKDAR